MTAIRGSSAASDPDAPLWRIGAVDGRSDDLVDTYSDPLRLGDVTWRVGAAGPQRWPRFHPSEADPEGGYREHRYRILFDIPAASGRGDVPPAAYALRIAYLSIAPRLANIRVELDGVPGMLLLHPRPVAGGELELEAALQASVTSEGIAEAILPTQLLPAGEHELALVAVDGRPFERIESIDLARRLDRMANASGLVYRSVALHPLPESPAGPVAAATLSRTPFERRTADGDEASGRGERVSELATLRLDLTGPVERADLRLTIEHDAGEPEGHVVELPGVAFGDVEVDLSLRPDRAPVRWRLEGGPDGTPLTVSGVAEPPTPWDLFVSPGVHTDIGYTHRQSEVAERLAWNIDTAIERGLVYHLDSAWALEHFLATRDERRIADAREAFAARRLGSSATYVDLLTQLAATEDLVRNRLIGELLLERVGAVGRYVTVVDVATITGSLPDLLAASGITALVHASNQDRGPFRLGGGLHRRSPFRWIGPAGGAVTVWLSKAYAELRKVLGSPPTDGSAERGLEQWLQELHGSPAERAGIALLYGQEADNTDLDESPQRWVERWGETHGRPTITLADPSRFFEEAARRGVPAPGDGIRGDGGAYWEDGAGSTLTETALCRSAQATLPAAERLASLAAIHVGGRGYPVARFDEAWRALLLFDEHTWGAFLSVRDPDALLAREQWAAKQRAAVDADAAATSLLHGAASAHALRWDAAGRELVVHNPNGWRSRARVRVEVAPHEAPVDPRTGAPLAARVAEITATQVVLEVDAGEIDGLSIRRFPLVRTVDPPTASRTDADAGPITIENAHHRLTLDPVRGGAVGWIARGIDRELVDRGDPWALGGIVHVLGGEGSRLVRNIGGVPEPKLRLAAATAPADTRIRVEESALGTTAELRFELAGGPLSVRWTIHAHDPAVDLEYVWQKPTTREREAAYVAFPLALPGASVRSDSQLGWVDWERDLLPGGCREWLPLQTSVLVSGEHDVAIASPDIPLFCVGDIVRGRWGLHDEPLRGGRVLSYVLNNHWHTNYRAEQGGELRWRYRLLAAPSVAPEAAYRFGWETRRPPYAHRMSLQRSREPVPAPYDEPVGSTLARLEPDSVALVALKLAARDGRWVARLQEIAGRRQEAALMIPGRAIVSAERVDLVERPIGALEPVDGELRLTLGPWELATVVFEVGE